ncbi:MAG: energy-coupling factor ABC transporter ATP-binding protein [Allorhizobium sp.]
MLEAHCLSYVYPDATPALEAVSIAVSAGEKAVILGANGAGKSTLLLALNGSLKPTAGEVRLHALPVDYSRKGLVLLRSSVGLVLQDPDDQLFAATVFEDVSFGPLNMGLSKAEARARVEQALASMGIEHLADRPTHMLSFGQRKRVALAGVLAMQPSVLLLDEPTAGLDPKGVEELMLTLSDLASQGTAIVIATHDMEVAYAWADHIAIFAGGRIVRYGIPEDVFADAEVLDRAGLLPPLVFQASRRLRDAGMLPAGSALPRSREQLMDAVDAISARHP